ncbi:TrkH family potassium uptake protein [Radiobacillus deserti]|uniref:Ktr system potassium transporter B n=1 Tax=Radiobacillus deserti TaxID=2594883 RepID=A0A516KF27_9BACI|nr:TrkH family potassium uptake protein [Radiobacillus deserti]QDP39999.1 Ktr system potassium transporter B [Radiobacillus deserti]
MTQIKKLLEDISPTRILACSFLVIILLGTVGLKLPISTTGSISWIDALFTAVSATTVTGLIVVDTATQFTMFGQFIIMIMIQIGGIGLMTFAVFVLLIMGRKISLKQRIIMTEAFNQSNTGGIVQLVKLLMTFGLSVEFVAFLLLSIKWVPVYGWKHGLFNSLFHTISSFNNAGFSTWSNNLMDYATDPIVNIVISFLFIVGGLGFTVISDLFKSRNWNSFMLHTKMMIVGTLVLNIVSTLLIFTLEYNNPQTIGGLSETGKWIASFFQAVSPRTAGFNTVNTGSMEDASLVYTMVLMFIGAGSASTGSGIKLTTAMVVLLATITFLRSKSEPVLYGRRIQTDIIIRSLAIIMMSIFVLFIFIFLLTITESAPFLAIAFEAISAFGTVGLSTGITFDLSTLGKVFIMILMFIGRIGPITFAFMLAKPRDTHVRYPSDQVFTG